MKLNELQIPKTATSKASKRRGRGSATGQGCTSGRGHKGQNSRSGGGVRRGFEGGQMPIIRRLPKKGFFNLFRKEYSVVNVSDIANKGLEGDVTPEVLVESGLIKKSDKYIKILGTGEIKNAVNIKAHAFSKSAREKIEKAGGKIEEI